MNNLLRTICSEKKNRHHDSRIRHHPDPPDYAKRQFVKERRLDCEKVRVQTWLPEV